MATDAIHTLLAELRGLAEGDGWAADREGEVASHLAVFVSAGTERIALTPPSAALHPDEPGRRGILVPDFERVCEQVGGAELLGGILVVREAVDAEPFVAMVVAVTDGHDRLAMAASFCADEGQTDGPPSWEPMGEGLWTVDPFSRLAAAVEPPSARAAA